MTTTRFSILFHGELMPEQSAAKVKARLAQLFKTDAQRIESLFSRTPKTLKRGLPGPAADRYLALLAQAGAIAHKVAEAPQLVATDGDQETPPSPYTPPKSDLTHDQPAFAQLRLFSSDGRIGRLRYLVWSACLLLAAALATPLTAALHALSEVLGYLFGFGALLAFVLVAMQIGIRRLHDIGCSGWFYLLTLVPYLGGLLGLLLTLLPGNSGANRYGAPPPPNSTGIKLLAALGLLLPLLALLALLSIYQDYLQHIGA